MSMFFVTYPLTLAIALKFNSWTRSDRCPMKFDPLCIVQHFRMRYIKKSANYCLILKIISHNFDGNKNRKQKLSVFFFTLVIITTIILTLIKIHTSFNTGGKSSAQLTSDTDSWQPFWHSKLLFFNSD